MSAFDRCCLLLGRAAVLLAVILAPVALAELAARWLHDPPPVRRVYDPFAYRIPRPLLVEELEGLDGERVTIRLNELGMRGPSIAGPPAPEALTLVFLGGSTTENYALPRRDTFPELIGETLAGRLGRPVRVLNAGMSAATTSVSLARLQHQVLDLEPSLVVVLHGINDLLSGFHPGYRRDGRHLGRPATAGTRPRSYLVDWLRRRSFGPRARPSGERLRYDDYRSFPALRVFARNLRSMAAVAAAHRVEILFLTQATTYREAPAPGDEDRLRMAERMLGALTAPPDIPSLARGMRAFNAATLELGTGAGARTFDLAARLPRSPALFYDECHLTRAGNRRVAEELAPVIERLLVGAAARPTG